MWHGFDRFFKSGKVTRQTTLPEQLSTPIGGQNYRLPTPAYDISGNLFYANFFWGNQVPSGHILTLPHAHYVHYPNKDISVQRSGAYFGQLVSSLDTAQLLVAARAAWAKAAGTNNG